MANRQVRNKFGSNLVREVLAEHDDGGQRRWLWLKGIAGPYTASDRDWEDFEPDPVEGELWTSRAQGWKVEVTEVTPKGRVIFSGNQAMAVAEFTKLFYRD